MQPEGARQRPRLCRKRNYRPDVHYSRRRTQCANHASGGCGMNSGDLAGPGTNLGPDECRNGVPDGA